MMVYPPFYRGEPYQDADIPTGCVVGSHSWREMMALAAYRAGKNWLRAAEFGF